MIRTTCPQCGREDAIADYLVALPVMCKSCGHRVTMGEPIAPPKPAPLPPPPPPPAKPQPVAPAAVVPRPSAPPVGTPSSPANEDHTPLALTPRPEFAQAVGPGVVDLFEDPQFPEPTREPTPRPILPPPPLAPSFHRGRRLVARIITLVGVAVALFAGVMLAAFAPNVVKNDKLMSTLFLLTPLTLYGLYNAALLSSKGQDFGKRAMKLRVVGDDGTPARFGRAFLRRELVVILLLAGVAPLAWKLYQLQPNGVLAGQWQRMGLSMFLPNRMPEVMPALAAVLFSLMNALMIFNKDGKCIHDRLAKTTVQRDDLPTTMTPLVR